MLLNWYSSIRKLRKVSMIFDIENWLWKSNFGTFSPLYQFSKFKYFLWVCWFSGKNAFNFVSPLWKLDNMYCHIVDKVSFLREYVVWFYPNIELLISSNYPVKFKIIPTNAKLHILKIYVCISGWNRTWTGLFSEITFFQLYASKIFSEINSHWSWN